MNIWIFNHYAITPKSSGGTRHYDLASELVKRNYQVTIFASSFEHQSRTDPNITGPKEKVKTESIDGITYKWIKTVKYKKNDIKRIWNMIGYTWRSFFAAIKTKENPDVVVGSLVHPLAAFLGYIISRMKGSLFYFEERDLWPQTLIDLGLVSKRHPAVKLLSWLELFLYKKADRIIILFKEAEDYIESRGISKEKVLVIPNGVDLKRYNRPKELPPLLNELFNTQLKDHFKAIYIGSHGVTDHLEPVLLSAKRLMEKESNVCMLFFGDGPEKEKLIKMKEAEKLDNVLFFPPVPKEYIPKLLENCDAGLLSMHDSELYKWGMSFNKLYDYTAAKLPIVLNSKRVLPELAKFGNIEWAKSHNEFADTLETLSNDKDQCEQLGMIGRDFLERNYTWEILSTRLIDALEKDVK
ncbi:glycosyltransferase family 4 protein [Bacillus sp. DTU_2020_1000418_1_SI_GHA_SEK_038]|uniref:glycosyltransferase family 4 protein n=1 Tax=Bacillus sp. DTU_2020_1000418_1_SI_GHA_SEK_038 TaxID=3077585 RepID=UPI0028EA1411|nr:glycosyltransferase family 4 protein [Bacillus sp. DTU_2020_1000418_1_SI_GHA_SEK_038]WNS74816.1 glycosyltransferase family 4 protein [Bacillus sp. DTU_2020_1000418_1_SI_GHA_SEK_038]